MTLSDVLVHALQGHKVKISYRAGGCLDLTPSENMVLRY